MGRSGKTHRGVEKSMGAIHTVSRLFGSCPLSQTCRELKRGSEKLNRAFMGHRLEPKLGGGSPAGRWDTGRERQKWGLVRLGAASCGSAWASQLSTSQISSGKKVSQRCTLAPGQPKNKAN